MVIMAEYEVELIDLKKLNSEIIPLKFRILYTTLFYSGMRPGEVCNMQSYYFHRQFDEKKQKQYYFYDLKTQKNGEQNELTPIRQQDYLAMKDYCELLGIGPHDFIFGSKKYKFKKPISVSWLDRQVADHCKLVGIEKKITAQSFRSGLVTYLREQGYGYDEISTITRHQNIRVMQKHYDKRIKKGAYELIEKMEKI